MSRPSTTTSSTWMSDNPSAPDPLDAAFTAEWLSRQQLPPVEYVVPGIIPEGLTLLVAPPKVGKSWMVLGIASAVAEGGTAFGAIPVDQRPVLYLALEDGPRRLQSRMTKIGAVNSEGLLFMPKLDAPASVVIGTFLDRFGHQKPLIILDTLGKVRGIYGGNDSYGHDYSQMSALKDLVDAAPGSSLVVVHHTNKGEKADFLDSVSGTQGLAGAADSILAIKRSRGSTDAALHVTSRDAAEGEYAVALTDGLWTLDGGSLQEAAETATERRQTAGLGDLSQQVYSVVQDAPNGVTPKTVAAMVAELHGDNDSASTYLRRLAESGRIRKTGRGRYASLEQVSEVFEVFESESESDSSLGDGFEQLPRVFESKAALTSHSDTSNTSNTPSQDLGTSLRARPEVTEATEVTPLRARADDAASSPVMEGQGDIFEVLGGGDAA